MAGRSMERVRRWVVIALLVGDAALVTLVLGWQWQGEPVDRAVHGTVAIEQCLPSSGVEANCYGTFTSDDGSVRIANAKIGADQDARVAEGWVDSAADRVVRTSLPDRPGLGDRAGIVAGIVLTVAANVAIIRWVLLDARPERP